jgi:cold-inducible RNA-binding protein
MAKTLYVGNLPYDTTGIELQDIFSELGAVASTRIVKDRHNGRSKGFGFVEMDDDNDAASAIDKLDGLDLSGRTIRVNEARPREELSNSQDSQM